MKDKVKKWMKNKIRNMCIINQENINKIMEINIYRVNENTI